MPRERIKHWSSGIAILAGGLAANVVALSWADRHAEVFPRVPDVIVDNLPFINLFAFGEAYLGLYIATALFFYWRQPSRNTPYLLALIGLFYVGRALFLLTLPIGAPEGAIHADQRFSPYPFGDHSYFPSGHFGLMWVLALSLWNRAQRRTLLFAALVFGAGALFTKAHYTADLLGGGLIAYAVHAWGERKLKYQWHDAGQPAAPDLMVVESEVRDERREA